MVKRQRVQQTLQLALPGVLRRVLVIFIFLGRLLLLLVLLRRNRAAVRRALAVLPTLGALTASAFGAGFGGSCYAIVSADAAEAFAAAWEGAYREQFPSRRGACSFFVPPSSPFAFAPALLRGKLDPEIISFLTLSSSSSMTRPRLFCRLLLLLFSFGGDSRVFFETCLPFISFFSFYFSLNPKMSKQKKFLLFLTHDETLFVNSIF